MNQNPEEILFDECVKKVEKIMGWERWKAVLWMTTENPHFGTAPSRLITMGRGHKVVQFINTAALLTNPPSIIGEPGTGDIGTDEES
jgi:hypothetical protein